jgi:NADPH:quinone reductase-like Zn-dependent oxidoreductase
MVLAGVIDSAGSAVTRFKAGEEVFAYDITRLSTYAEYACVPEDSAIAPKPAAVTFEEAAAAPFGGVTALYFLKKGNIRSGQNVLIYGAAGGVGTFAVQLAKHFGAEVTGICSAPNIEMVRSLGADHIIDYTREDFTGSGKSYDIIFDTVGKTSLFDSLKVLKPQGSYLQTVSGPALLIQMQWAAIRTGKTLIGGTAVPTREHLEYLIDLVATGKIKPVIDRCYPLEEIVAAHRYVDGGHKRGSVVISVAQRHERAKQSMVIS